MSSFSITSRGQVTIPKAVRQQLGLRAGSKVRFRVVGDHIEIERVVAMTAAASTSAAGMLRRKGPACPADFDPAQLLGNSEDSRGR